MMPVRLRNIIGVLLLLSTMVSMEYIRQTYALPISFIDIFLTPLLLVFMLFLFINLRSQPQPKEDEPPSRTKRYRALVTALGMLGIGSWALYEGASNPFSFFSGVKGSLHGYSLAVFGLVILIFACLILYTMLRKR